MPIRILVVDGYSKEARDELAAGGASLAGHLYTTMLKKLHADIQCDVLFASDPEANIPTGASLKQYAGVAWTGCSLTIYDDDPRVHRQAGLARAAFELGIPGFGSCWGLQMAVFAAGGLVRAHPRGREMGLARKITLTPAGRGHPLFRGKSSVFDAFISHVDEVTHVPPGTVVLATNDFTRVQAASISFRRGTFWGLQYHPEYNLHEMARLIHCRSERLIAGGFFKDAAAVDAYVESLTTLYKNPSRVDLAWQLGYDTDVLDETVRTCEVRNWLDQLVIPRLGSRGVCG